MPSRVSLQDFVVLSLPPLGCQAGNYGMELSNVQIRFHRFPMTTVIKRSIKFTLYHCMTHQHLLKVG